MSTADSRKRIAVVVPKHRAWPWHRQVISSLQETFDVVIYVSADAAPYPLFIRAWLAFENTFLKGRTWAQAESIFGQLLKGSEGDFFFILNLSESSIGSSSAPIIEPRYDNSPDSICLLAAIINRNAPLISFQLVGSIEPLVASYLAIRDKATLGGGLQPCFSRLAALAERAAKHLLTGSHAGMLPPPTPASSAISVLSVVLFISRFSYRVLRRSTRAIMFDEHWSIRVMWANHFDIPGNVPLKKFTTLKDDRRRFYADPFVFSRDGRKWIFAEEYRYREKRGVICCGELKTGKTTTSFRPALSRPYHLSYPFVFQHEECVYMLPETGSNHQVELYRARSFPFDWVLERVILDNIEMYDPTILHYENRWWIFGTTVHENGSNRDELAIFYSDRLDGCWKPHRLNPVKSDCRTARPAGRIIVVGDRLLRPAQDCENGYGMGVVWLEIIELTPDKYDEREIAHWPGSAVGAQGLHTFNRDDELAVVDTSRTFVSLKGIFRQMGHRSVAATPESIIVATRGNRGKESGKGVGRMGR